MRLVAGIIVAVFCISEAWAGAGYDSQENVVSLATPLRLYEDLGRITIRSEEHIKIFALGRDRAIGKMVGLCGINPSLGLVALNGQPSVHVKTPRVTRTSAFTSPHESTQRDIEAGWVYAYVLEGEDAQDLLDLLYEYESVGFLIPPGNLCKETEYTAPGSLILNFSTQGFERAMKRLK